ncbi:MAG: glycosyltransferase family 2 protein [Bacteroidales bacterium]|nr:glycosyltransferase family 2 protein [Bacteroidales bacterium]
MMSTILGISCCIFFMYALVVYAIQVIIAVLSFRQLRRSTTEVEPVLQPVKYSVIIPMHNESKSIIRTVRSLLYQSWKPAEIIIVDDGSTDESVNLIKSEINKERDNVIKIIQVSRSGKGDALDIGIHASEFAYICLADADIVASPDAIENMFEHMHANDCIAVSSVVFVHKSVSYRNMLNEYLITSQEIEYLRALLWRPGWAFLNALGIIEGRLGLFEREYLLKIGPCSNIPAAIDYYITLCLHKIKGKRQLGIAPKSIVYTDVPVSVRGLFRQRIRWSVGLGLHYWSNRNMLFNKKYGKIGYFELPVRYITSYLPLFELLLLTTFVLSLFFNNFLLNLLKDLFIFHFSFLMAQIYSVICMGTKFTRGSLRRGLIHYLIFSPLYITWEPLKGMLAIIKLIGKKWLIQDKWQPDR